MSQTLKTSLQRGILFACLALAMAPIGSTALIIRIDDPLTNPGLDIEVTDGGGGDLFGPNGMVTIADTLFNGQTVSASAASTPLTGTDPKLDLVSLTITGVTHGTLQISATRTDFSPTDADTEFIVGIGGTTEGSVTASAYMDANNLPFATTSTVHQFAPFSGPAFSGSAANNLATESPNYSLTLLVDVFHDDPYDVTSFDFFIAADTPRSGSPPIPEPASLTLGLIGLALLGSHLARRKSLFGQG